MFQCFSQAPKYLKNMSTAERREFINSFDLVFSDIDGVISQSMPSGPFPGVHEGIQFLKLQGKSVKYVTNNSTFPIIETVDKFHQYGISVKQEDFIHPAQTISEYLKQINFKGLIYCLATNAFRDHLRNAGFELLDVVRKIIELLNINIQSILFVAKLGYR